MKMLGSRAGAGAPSYDASEDAGSTRPAAKAASGTARAPAKGPAGIADMDDDIPF
jgi:single-stranded DNA-binding protein